MRGRFVPRDDIVEDVLRVADVLGRSPYITEYEELGKHARGTIYRRFDSWKCTLEAADLDEPTRAGEGCNIDLAAMDPEDVGLTPLGERPR